MQSSVRVIVLELIVVHAFDARQLFVRFIGATLDSFAVNKL
jgi:hypothetical protein